MQSIEEKVAELKARKQGLQEAKDFIEEKKKEYEAAIEKPAAFAEREEREIRALLASKVPVSLQTYIEELAKLWNTKVRNLDPTLIITTFSDNMTLEQMVKELLSEFLYSSSKCDVSFLVTYKDGPVMHCACIKRPFTKELLQSTQKDGKSFISHLRADVVRIDSEDRYESTIVCDDFTPLVFNFTFGDMIKIMYDPNHKTEDNIALLNAAIRDNQACKQEEKSL